MTLLNRKLTDKPLLEYPCDFEFKVIGKNSEAFQTEVLMAIRQHVPNLKEDCLKENKSKEKNYLSISITVHLTSQQQLENIYADLKKCQDVVMTL